MQFVLKPLLELIGYSLAGRPEWLDGKPRWLRILWAATISFLLLVLTLAALGILLFVWVVIQWLSS